MTWLEAFVLGFVQGATEFLPISSSGHLVIVQQLLGIAGSSLTFDIFLHFATIIAVIIFFFKDLLQLRLKDLPALLVASMPAGIVGVLFHDTIETLFSGLHTTGIEFLISAAINFGCWYLLIKTPTITERLSKLAKNMAAAVHTSQPIPLKTALVVGIFQAIAIVPAISRSGSTVFGGLLMGLDRERAFKFSFIMSIPVILGANALEILKIVVRHTPITDWSALLVGCVVAGVVGYASLFLLQYMITKAKFHWFGWYCVAVGVLLIAFKM